jgi:hypothetical protein
MFSKTNRRLVDMINKIIWLLMACMLSVCSVSFAGEKNAGDVIVFSEDFKDSAAAVKKLNLNTKMWEVSDGAVRSRNGVTGGSTSFAFGDTRWCDYEVEFKIKQLEVNPKNYNFSIFVRCNDNYPKDTSHLRFYCGGTAITYIETVDKKRTRHNNLGLLPKPLGVGEQSPWSTFKIVVSGSTAAVYVDGVLIGKVENVAPGSGNLAIFPYNVNIMLTDLKVTVLRMSGEQQNLKASHNILPNSSFEFCTQDNLPDYWGCLSWGITDPYWAAHFDEWVKNYGTDSSTAFDGVRSMRINNPLDKPDRKNGVFYLCSVCNLGAAVNKPYILSAYMKSAVPGMKVSLSGKEISLTMDWQRYSTSYINNGRPVSDAISIYPIDSGTFWVDALQLEEGSKPTPYVYSLRDRLLAVQSERDASASLNVFEARPGAFDVPESKPAKINGNIALDGRLDKSVWKGAPELPFRLLNGGAPHAIGFAKMLYNDKGIYIGTYCKDQNAKQNICKEIKRDGYVWLDPSIEIFIDPDLSRANYYHLGYNQAGTQFDGKKHDASWDCNWKVATYTGDGFWSAEAFLPFGEMGIDGRVGEWWGINICANNFTTKENTCWSPTYGGFHTPERFGKIFIDSATLSNYRVYVNDVKLQSLPSENYALSLQLVNATNADHAVQVQADFKDSAGRPVKLEQKTSLPQNGTKKITLGDFKMEPDTQTPCSITLKSADKTITVNSTTRTLAVAPVMEVMTQYDRYTSEPEILTRVRLNISEETAKSAKLVAEVSNNRGVILSKGFTKLSAGETYIKIPGIGKLADGEYNLSFKCLDAKGKDLASFAQNILKLAPALHEVKTDRISRVLMVDGKPFIPVGLLWEGQMSPELLQYLKTNGSNTVVAVLNRYRKEPWSSYLRPILDNAEKSGLKVKIFMGYDDKGEIGKVIQEFKQHPAVLAWETYDEVFTTEWGKNNHNIVTKTLKELGGMDPYHPVGMNDNEYGISYLKSKGLDFPGDIVSIDYYPYPPSGNIAGTADYVKLAHEIGRKDGKSSSIYLFGAGYAYFAPREFTPAEQEYSTYLSVISGATGVIYFASHPKSKSNWSAICRLMREITKLTPVIASPLEVPVVECSSPAVKFTVRKYDGALYLIAVNGSKGQVSATFDLSGATALKGGAEVLFEGRKIALKNNVLTDTFAGYQRHVYRVDIK